MPYQCSDFSLGGMSDLKLSTTAVGWVTMFWKKSLQKISKIKSAETLLHSFHTIHQLPLSKLKEEKRWKELLVVTPPLKPPSLLQPPSCTADHRTARANIASPPVSAFLLHVVDTTVSEIPEAPADKGRLCLHYDVSGTDLNFSFCSLGIFRLASTHIGKPPKHKV